MLQTIYKISITVIYLTLPTIMVVASGTTRKSCNCSLMFVVSSFANCPCVLFSYILCFFLFPCITKAYVFVTLLIVIFSSFIFSPLFLLDFASPISHLLSSCLLNWAQDEKYMKIFYAHRRSSTTWLWGLIFINLKNMNHLLFW